jgi:hypothetical protein
MTAPVYRPLTTDCRGERRFLSTIIRGLEALGALTRGSARPDRRISSTLRQSGIGLCARRTHAVVPSSLRGQAAQCVARGLSGDDGS